MEFFQRVFYGNTVESWAIAAGIALAVMVVLRGFKGLVLSRLKGLTSRTRTNIDDIVVRTLDNTRWFFYGGLGIYLGSKSLEFGEPVERAIEAGAAIILFVQVGVWLQSAVRLSVDHYSAKHGDAPSTGTLAAAIGFLGRLIIWSLVFLLTLSHLGVEISALLAGLGIGGIAAALALQNVLGDLFASLSIYFDRPFDIGDFIIVDEFMGNVERIGMRSTRIRSLGGEQIVFSNSDLAKSRIRNYRRMEERRVVFSVGIEYNLPYEKVARAPELLKEAVEEQDGVRFDRAHFKSYGDFALSFEIVYYVLSADFGVYMDKQQAINLAIYGKFEKAGLPFAFPTSTTYLRAENPVPVSSEPAGRGVRAP